MIYIINKNMPYDMIEKLKENDDLIIPTLDINCILSSVSTHPDIQIHQADNNTIFCAPEVYEYYKEQIPDRIKIICGSVGLGGTYPDDCAYNISVIGKYVLCNTKAADKKILDYHNSKNRVIVHTNQGYTKCNICIINQNTVITEDVGLHNTINRNCPDINSHLIPKGEVLLEGFEFGFIGGASFTNYKTVVWFGDIKRLSYYKKIEEVLAKNNMESLCLSKSGLLDLGGIICLP